MGQPIATRVQMFGKWEAVGGFATLGSVRGKQILARAGKRGAEVLHAQVVRFYRQGGPNHPALHPFTVQQKGSSKPLVDTGELWQSVEIFAHQTPQGGFEYLIGIPAGPLADVANVQEYGAVIQITAAMRAYLAAQGLRLNAKTQYIFIPSRPVFLPAVRVTQKMLGAILDEEIDRELEAIASGKRDQGFFKRVAGRLKRMVF